MSKAQHQKAQPWVISGDKPNPASAGSSKKTVGTVLTGDEAKLVDVIDDYAAKHSLAGRSAVVREA